ncbi:hypothetical protein [Pseudanabaena sp. Chao 1811]|uniref:hypothetical protein n=1 Tax=Pseudanabaena sp. Chao 1811 TaxID=2963092 RepID=UPI0022F3E3F8|nr:hypothetical protein [Pseudanabaena sp. Chao 1811]
MNQILFPDIQSSKTEQECQCLDNCSSYQESKKYIEEIANRDFLNAIALSLNSANQIAAYIITGGAFGYSFRDAIVQVTPSLLYVYRWTEVTENIVESGFIRGKIDWQKVIAAMKQDGHTPDENLKSKNFQDHFGRDIMTYAVSKSDRAWVKILSGSYRLSVHRLHHLMVELVNRKIPLN